MADPKDDQKLFEESFQVAVRGVLGHKITEGKEAIQQSRALIETQFETVNEVIGSFQTTASRLLELGGDTREKKKWARSFLADISTELLEQLVADWAWAWDSGYLRLAASNASVVPERPEAHKSPTWASALQSADGPALDSYAIRILKEHGHKKVRDIIDFRPAVQLKDNGYVFEWPPGSGLHCVVHCVRCGFTSDTNPLDVNHAFAVQTHWNLKHPEWKGADSFLLYTVIMTVFIFRVEGHTLDEIRQHNSSITLKFEAKKRKDKSRRQTLLTGPAPSPPCNNNNSPAKTLKRYRTGTLKEIMAVAPRAKTTIIQHKSNNGPPPPLFAASSLLPFRPKAQPAGTVQVQRVQDPGGEGHASSDDEPMMGRKRLRCVIEIDDSDEGE
ncbi:hypothetical protein PG991_013918 [Apiospora marii]|uniref:HNH nuclease domain-containing protein n=1 Tax=Apiospora marii TaxID=335849 RepID=A0ABR1R882_9PEZI